MYVAGAAVRSLTFGVRANGILALEAACCRGLVDPSEVHRQQDQIEPGMRKTSVRCSQGGGSPRPAPGSTAERPRRSRTQKMVVERQDQQCDQSDACPGDGGHG